MKKFHYLDTIISPNITEKSTSLSEFNKIVFKVDRGAKKESIKKNIDPKITNRIWKHMIMSYIDFEKRNFKKK